MRVAFGEVMLNQKDRGQHLATSYYFCSPTGDFADVTSAFESWQVLRHSNLFVKPPTLAIYSTNAKVSTHARFYSQIHESHPLLSQQLRRQLLIYISCIYSRKFQDTIMKFLNNFLQILLSGRALNFQKSKTLNFCIGLSYNFYLLFFYFCSPTST